MNFKSALTDQGSGGTARQPSEGPVPPASVKEPKRAEVHVAAFPCAV
jgi:hypothetical protein